MKEVLIVTTYQRPEMLACCLDRIAELEFPGDLLVMLAVDRCGDELSYTHELELLNEFAQKSGIAVKLVRRNEHPYDGNSFNVLESYKDALALGADFVYLVEDDVMVSTDFLRWHRAVHNLRPWFCTIASENTRRRDLFQFSDPSLVYGSKSDYASLGVCWPKDSLKQVVKHATKEYYNDLSGYCRRNFSKNRFANEFTEQDGLIMRVLGEVDGLVGWAYVPRAFHVGYYGYHRGGNISPRGDLRSRVAQLESLISDQDMLNRYGVNDLKAFIPSARTWDRLIVDQVYN